MGNPTSCFGSTTIRKTRIYYVGFTNKSDTKVDFTEILKKFTILGKLIAS